jgi:hypothetical protein
MKKSTTLAAVVPAAIVEETWQEVGASFERFCLTAGIATLTKIMEEDAVQLCGSRYGREAGKHGHRWGKTKSKIGLHGGKIEIARPRAVPATVASCPCRAGRRPSPRTCSASGAEPEADQYFNAQVRPCRLPACREERFPQSRARGCPSRRCRGGSWRYRPSA